MNEVLRALDHIELKRAFGDYFGCSIEELYVRESRPLPPNPGLAGDKLICEVSMRSEGRALPPVECWIKRMVTPDHREAHLYRSLHRSQFPLPKFYGHYLDERSREVLLLEYIPRVGHSLSPTRRPPNGFRFWPDSTPFHWALSISSHWSMRTGQPSSSVGRLRPISMR